MLGNDGEDEYADADLSMDMGDDDSYENEEYGDYEAVWSDLTPDSEIHGAAVDADDNDALTTRMPTKEDNSVDEARDDNLDVYVPVEASFLRNRLERETKGERKPEEVEENDDDEDEEREDTDDDEEKRNSRSVQSDTDTGIDDTLGANPAPPFTPPFAFLTEKAGNKNESERFIEELRSGRGISESPSPFPVPPQTPGSKPKCNFSYPRPCTAIEPGEHPYPRKVISHIFGRKKKVTQQIPPWICVYYCRRHYQRARYRAGKRWP
ncbi:hypothetical protein BDW60DRAFT_204324 [Aspergillus nidulans var. acristatus]